MDNELWTMKIACLLLSIFVKRGDVMIYVLRHCNHVVIIIKHGSQPTHTLTQLEEMFRRLCMKIGR